METIQSFKDLIVWQKSMALAQIIYEITEKLPQKEVYGLTSQMRRCAVSIPSNIAEGRQRKTKKDFAQFLHIALGSLGELETQLILGHDIYHLDISPAEAIVIEIRKMLSVMLNKLS